jgi:hypothetical protein
MSGIFIGSIEPPVFTPHANNVISKHIEDSHNRLIAETIHDKDIIAQLEELKIFAGVSEDQFNGIVIQSSRGIGDEIIINSIAIDAIKLAQIRTTEKYKKALAAKSINIVTNNINADIIRDKLELRAINELMNRMNNPGNTMETMEVLAIAKSMNQAKRRYGVDNGNSFQPKGNGDINVTQNIVNLAIPSIVLKRLKNVSSGMIAVKSEEQYINQYGDAKAQEIDIKRVSEVLGVDLSKPNAREATISETYNNLFEDTTIVGDNVSIMEGEG